VMTGLSRDGLWVWVDPVLPSVGYRLTR
jgi:hypothetical protein